jgi:ATP-binding cassette subfamily C protein CydD
MRGVPDHARPESLENWLRRAARHSRQPLTFAIAFGLLAGLALIGQAWLLARVVDGVIFRHDDLDRLWPWLWTLLGIFMVRALLALLCERTAFHAAARIKARVRDEVFRHLQALGPVYLHHRSSGDLTNTVVDGVEALDAYYSRFLPQMALAALLPLSILAFVFPVDWRAGLILLVTGPLIPASMIFIGKGAERLNQKQWRKLARMSAHFLDVLQGLTTLKLFNASRREAAVMARISDDYRRSTMSVLRVAFLSALALEFFSTLSVAIVAVVLGFRLLWGDMAFFPAFFVLLLAPEFYLPLRRLGTFYHARMEAIGAAERIVEILTTPLPEAQRGAKTLQGSREIALYLQKVKFSYDGVQTALNGISLSIEPCTTVALVGPSGAGKSTLAALLLRFIHPVEGTVSVNGTDLKDLDDAYWLRHVAWIPQQPRIVHGTVADNIHLGRPDADMAEVAEAARLAKAEAFIERLPLGYRTLLGEGGRTLSGGERQRIAIARAFLKDAPLVVLDEATANLDLESEALVRAAISRLGSGRTMVMIAHRLSTVAEANQIVVLDRGRVVEQGSHRDLLAGGGLYTRLVSAYRGVA